MSGAASAEMGQSQQDELPSIGPRHGGKLSSGEREKGQLESLLEETGRAWRKAGDVPYSLLPV